MDRGVCRCLPGGGDRQRSRARIGAEWKSGGGEGGAGIELAGRGECCPSGRDKWAVRTARAFAGEAFAGPRGRGWLLVAGVARGWGRGVGWRRDGAAAGSGRGRVGCVTGCPARLGRGVALRRATGGRRGKRRAQQAQETLGQRDEDEKPRPDHDRSVPASQWRVHTFDEQAWEPVGRCEGGLWLPGHQRARTRMVSGTLRSRSSSDGASEGSTSRTT